MNATQAENLRILIRHMETNVTRRLDMTHYFEPCGAPACAAGEACMVPALRAQGMDAGFMRLPNLSVITEVFGDVYGPLFSGCLNSFRNISHVSPQEWAAEARDVLTGHGYSMDEKPDAFAVFMAKVREPVAVEA